MARSFTWKRQQVLLRFSRVAPELRDTCIEIASKETATQSMKQGRREAIIAGLHGLDELSVGKATRWLAKIRLEDGQPAFEEVVEKLKQSS